MLALEEVLSFNPQVNEVSMSRLKLWDYVNATRSFFFYNHDSLAFMVITFIEYYDM